MHVNGDYQCSSDLTQKSKQYSINGNLVGSSVNNKYCCFNNLDLSLEYKSLPKFIILIQALESYADPAHLGPLIPISLR